MTVRGESENWRKSSYSGVETNCVEVGRVSGGAAMRDTKDRAAGRVVVESARWAVFVAAIKADRFA